MLNNGNVRIYFDYIKGNAGKFDKCTSQIPDANFCFRNSIKLVKNQIIENHQLQDIAKF